MRSRLGGPGDGDLRGGERRRFSPSFDRVRDGGDPRIPLGLELLLLVLEPGDSDAKR